MRKTLVRWLRGSWGPLLMVALCFLVSHPYFGQAQAATPSFFTSVNDVIGVAASGNRLYVTQYCGDPRDLLTIDSAGHASVLARLPDRGGGCYEDYLAISPGLGGYPANYIYVVQGPNIIQVSPSGGSVTHFATIASLPETHNGITFDQVGTFGYAMIITGSTGEVWRVSSSGAKTLVANAPSGMEGPVVAPLSFAPYGGQIIAASELLGRVYAISPAGAVATVAMVNDAESVHVVPNSVCNFGNSGGAFFSAMFPTHMAKFPAADFAGMGGSLLVTSEAGGIWSLSSVGGSIVQTVFNGNIGQHEGSAFVDCTVPPCTINPSVGWNDPLSETTTALLKKDDNLPIRFNYGTCAGFIDDESVVINVADHNDPSSSITTWVYGSDIAIDLLQHAYSVDFPSWRYGLSVGMVLQVEVYMGGDLVSTALVRITP
jgi:hypothetical protein